jgi:Zn-dependent protease with chaperone function
MREIHGEIFDARSSRNFPALLRDKGNGEFQIAWNDGKVSYPLRSVKVSARLGNSPRNFSLPGGWKFETSDNDAVDAILIRHKAHGWRTLVKSNFRNGYLWSSLLLLLLLFWALWQFGTPLLANLALRQLPPNISEMASARSLHYLDEQLFGTSKIPDRMRKHLQKHFSSIIESLPGSFQFELQFRRGGEHFGANAVTLPSGLVILTDELVKLAANEEELVGIMAHEVGHVVKRHALRHALQFSLSNLFYAFTVGQVANMDASVTAMLTQQGYTIAMEREADEFAYNYLSAHAISGTQFAELMKRIDYAHQRRTIESEDGAGEAFEYFSTHPDVEQRLERFNAER